jgi:Niemann-Pick C1 protein
MYGTWETNRVIAFELVRNLALALACVFVITLVLLVDIKLCLLLTVLLTLADVFGVLYFMGVKIDTDSCICVMTVVGLCVDYSAQIAHSFSVAEGLNSQDRMSTTLVTIGPAILKGGTTTFLALIFIGFSTSYAYGVISKARMCYSCLEKIIKIIIFSFIGFFTFSCLWTLSWTGPATNFAPHFR